MDIEIVTRGEQVGQIARLDRLRPGREPRERGRPAEHRRARGSAGAELANSGIARRLAQLLAAVLPDQGMVQEHRRRGPAEQATQADLAAGRPEQVFSSYHQVHPVPQVVHHHRELVGPLAQPVAQEEIAALARREARDWQDPFVALAASEHQARAARQRALLRRLGAPVVAAPAQRLEQELLERYEALRRSRRI